MALIVYILINCTLYNKNIYYHFVLISTYIWEFEDYNIILGGNASLAYPQKQSLLSNWHHSVVVVVTTHINQSCFRLIFRRFEKKETPQSLVNNILNCINNGSISALNFIRLNNPIKFIPISQIAV